MSERVLDPRTGPEALANCAASIAVNAWFVLAAIGHWVFIGGVFPSYRSKRAKRTEGHAPTQWLS